MIENMNIKESLEHRVQNFSDIITDYDLKLKS